MFIFLLTGNLKFGYFLLSSYAESVDFVFFIFLVLNQESANFFCYRLFLFFLGEATLG